MTFSLFVEFMGEQLVRQRFREQTEQNADNQVIFSNSYIRFGCFYPVIIEIK